MSTFTRARPSVWHRTPGGTYTWRAGDGWRYEITRNYEGSGWTAFRGTEPIATYRTLDDAKAACHYHARGRS